MLSLFRKIRKGRELKREHKRLLTLMQAYNNPGKDIPVDIRDAQFRMIVLYGWTLKYKAKENGLHKIYSQIFNDLAHFAQGRVNEIKRG